MVTKAIIRCDIPICYKFQCGKGQLHSVASEGKDEPLLYTCQFLVWKGGHGWMKLSQAMFNDDFDKRIPLYRSIMNLATPNYQTY